MKKLLIFATVFAIIACPLFAAAATKAAATAAPAAAASSKMITVTKELSTGSYPGVLVPGSLIGTDVYLSDLNLLANTVLFEYVKGTEMGMIVYKTDFGTIGASIAPAFLEDLGVHIHKSIPQNVLGLLYATKLGSMPFGAGIRYSVQKSDFENNNLNGYNPANDFDNRYDQYLSLKSGIGLNGLDLGAAITLLSNSVKLSNYAGNIWDNDLLRGTSTLQIDLSGRLDIGSGFIASATLSWLTAQDDVHVLANGGVDFDNRWNNSMLTLHAVLGKDLKIMESLIVKIAAGLDIGGNMNGKFQHIDNIDPTSSYLGTGPAGPQNGDRTQYGYLDIPLNVAVEAKLNDTWTLNSGVQATILGFNNTQSMYNTSDILDLEKITNMYTSTSVSINPGLDYAIGLTGKIGDLTLDLMLNPQIFLNGPYFISGNDLSSGMNTSVALHYDWN